MKYNDTLIFKTLNDYKKMLENKGYNVIYIGLYGSQNYNLDDEKSDIDAKAIVMPSLNDVIFRKTTSKTVECENGKIDVKDLITFYEIIKKGNFSYIESIQTRFSIGDKYIKDLFSKTKVNKKSILGAMYEKRKALTHEYPSKKEEFTQWGYDPKQHHHILRLYDILKYNALHSTNNAYLTYELDNPRRIELLNYKRNKNDVAKEIVEKDSDSIIEKAKLLIESDYVYEVVDLDYEINNYIEGKIKMILRNSDISYAREVRTFNNKISKSDIKKFPILEQYQGQDISYLVTESIEIL